MLFIKNIIRYIGCTVGTALLLTGCINDGLDPCPTDSTADENLKDYYYINLNVTAPILPSTRAGSYTDNDSPGDSSSGTLAGVSKENQLVSAHVYFCQENTYTVLADFESDYVAPIDDQGNTNIRIRISDINALEKLVGETNVKVLIVGNKKLSGGTTLYDPTVERYNLTSSTITINSVTGTDDTPNMVDAFGDSGQILPLVSAEAYNIAQIPDTDGVKTVEDVIKGLFGRITPTNAWWDVNTVSNPITLERAVARFEFRGKMSEDGSEETFDYIINQIPDVSLRLYSMTPFNINSKSYLFRHTSVGTDDAWGGTTSVQPFGKEKGEDSDKYNWIVSPWWPAAPSLLNAYGNDGSNYLIANGDIGAANGNVKIEDIAAVNTSEVYNSNMKTGGYHPWYYVTENTLYSQAQMEDGTVESLATGVGFKFIVLDSNNEIITRNTHANGENFPDEIKWSVEKEGYLEITDLSTYKWVELAPVSVTIDGETIQAYCLDYIAIIRHNAKTDDLAPMYYGVVRNNTYQMSISAVSGLPNPNDPKNHYIDLSINVLNWSSKENTFDW